MDHIEPSLHAGRFELKRSIGAGGMGVVYLAHDPELERDVAVKFLLHSMNDARGAKRLLREAQAMAKVQHPNVVTVYEAGTTNEHVWVAMELIDGGTLRKWLKARRRMWNDILDTMVAAGRGISAVHSAGLVHRDIKPDNIMISRDGRVRLMDFGLVRVHRDLASAPDVPSNPPIDPVLSGVGAMFGTPRYMAPEQYMLAQTDERTDQFAWCVTCWEAIYGAHPFPGKSLSELALAITTGAVRDPPASAVAPEWLRNILKRGMSLDPAARFRTMDALFAAISANRPTFEGLVAAKNAAALRIEAIIGLVLVPAFWTLDWMVLPSWVWWTLPLRMGCSVYAVLIIICSIFYPRWILRWVIPISFTYSLFIYWSIAAMCFMEQGYESPYYAGLNLLQLAVGQFFFWDIKKALSFAGLAYGFYMVPLALGMIHISDTALVMSNQFFLLSTLIISVVSQVHRLSLLRREFAERALQEKLLAEAQSRAGLQGAGRGRLRTWRDSGSRAPRSFAPSAWLHRARYRRG